jgi:hypothetical protein
LSDASGLMKSESEAYLAPESPVTVIGDSDLEIKGRRVVVPSTKIDERNIVTTGKWLKVAAVRHEELVEGPVLANPESFILKLKKSGLKADILTFAQKLPQTTPMYTYFKEWENVAAIPITTYERWWKESAEYSIRKAVNKAKKLGVVARVIEFSDEFVKATCLIYNETSVRQGKAFWHFGKEFETIKSSLGTYLDRSTFIGAYLQDELIGFMKITWVETTGTITQILSMKRHFDKRPNNALIAKAVETCATEGKSHFIYGSYVYHDPNSSLTEFKRRNGFEPVSLPRYFMPLTPKGKLSLALGLHRGIAANTPKSVMRQFLKIRSTWSTRRARSVESKVPAESPHLR